MAPPPAPPPPPPPPPIGEAFVESNQPSTQVNRAGSVPQSQTAPQPPSQNAEPSPSGEKVWERPWTFDEMRKNSSGWTLAADAGLLLYLQQFSQKMISQTHEIEKQVDGLVNSTKGIDSKVKNTVNDLLMLSNLQFIENRVYDDHEEETKDSDEKEQEQSQEKPKEKTREQREAEVIPRISEALKHGIGVLDEAFITLDLVTEQEEEEESDDEDSDVKINYKPQPILEPKDVYANRPLPHLIGTVEFFKDDLVGLAESSGEESEGEEEVSETESESETEEDKTSESGSEESESYSESESEFSSSEEESGTKEKQKPKRKKVKDSSSDEDLFGDKRGKEESGSSEEEDNSEEEEKPKKAAGAPLDFASELAAKLGGKIPVKQSSDEEKHEEGGWSDDEQQIPQPPKQERPRTETSKSHGDSRSKEKRGHSHHEKHHHHGDKSKGSHGHRRKRHDSHTSKASMDSTTKKDEDDLFAPPSAEDDGLFGDAGPFKKKGGLFSGGGGLFDDNDQGDLFAEDKEESSKNETQETAAVEDDGEEDLQIKPRSRSTASGKKIPAGAVSIFGESGIFGSPTKEPMAAASPPKSGVKKQTTSKSKLGGGGLFDDGEEESDLFGSNAGEKKQSAAQEHTKPSPRKETKKVDLFGGDDGDEAESDLFADKPVAPKETVQPEQKKKKLPAGAVSIFGSSPPPLFGSKSEKTEESNAPEVKVKTEPKTFPPVSEVSKAKSGGGGLFSDDGEEGGGLFGSPPKPKPESQTKPKSKPKTKTTISLFDDDDEQDEEDDFFAAVPAKSKSVANKKQEEDKKPSKTSGLFGDDEGGTIDSAVPQLSPAVAQPPAAAAKEINKTKPKSSSKIQSMFDDEDDGMFGGENEDLFSSKPKKPSEPVSEGTKPPVKKPTTSLFNDNEDDLFAAKEPIAQQKEADEPAKIKKPAGAVDMFGGVNLFAGVPPPLSRSIEKPDETDNKEIIDKPSEQASGVPLGGEDGLFSTKPKAKPPVTSAPSKSKPSKGLFSDEEDDLFGSPAKPPEKPAVRETKPAPSQTRQPDTEPEVEEEKPKPKKPPVGAVSMFGGADLFGGGGVSPPSAALKSKGAKKMADPLGGGGLFGAEEEEEDLFATKPKTAAKPVARQADTEPDVEDAKLKPKKPPAGAVSMFGGADLFGGRGVTPPSAASKPKGAKKIAGPLGGGGLFGAEEEEEDLFATKPKPAAKPEEEAAVDDKDQESVVKEKPRPKKPVGAVSMFGGVDMFGKKPMSPPKPSTLAKPAGDKKGQQNDLLGGEEKSASTTQALPVPKSNTQPRMASVSPGSSVAKIQKSLAFNVASLLPGAAPPSRQPAPTVATFDEPAEIKTLQTAAKDRAKIQVKRRPPTRRAIQVAATQSATDELLFGSSLTAKTDRADGRPLSFPAASNLLTDQENIAPVRTESAASDMSDDFFGFTSTKASIAKSKEETVSSSPKLSGSPSDDLFSTSKLSKKDLFGDDGGILGVKSVEKVKTEVTPSKTKLPSEESKTFSPLGEDLFTAPPHKGETKSKDAKTSAKVVSPLEEDTLFAAPSRKEETKSKDAKMSAKVVSPLEEDVLFSAPPEKDGKKAKETKSVAEVASPVPDDDLFAVAKTETKNAIKEKKPDASKLVSSEDDDLFRVSEKSDNKTKSVETKVNKAIPNPLEDTEDVVKSPLDGDKSLFDTGSTTGQEKVKQDAKKTSAAKPKALLDDDDDLFSISKKAEPRKPRKMVKPLGDDDLFGDSGNIFDDVPSKPKEKKKKKSVPAKEDIFGDASAKAGGEKAAKKTKTKKKVEKKSAVKSIFDDDAPSIFDDPLNATGQ